VCSCIEKADEMLRERGQTLVVSQSIDPKTLTPGPPRVVVRTELLEKRRRRESDPQLAASYCPFCGESYRLGEE
jgi:hypothetical protein